MDFKEILKQYWGYSAFRELQEDIIRSVYQGKDTLGLLPTGGGKSITFQVPALAKPGLCLVISPLIALMKDQVENLRKKGIKATLIVSGMSFHEIMINLDNACFDKEMKFLYVSPERLQTPLFRERLSTMKINLIAVDEAHCISQWGYDFRPAYLNIAEIREYLRGVPVLALTATATPDVVDDIQEKLKFKQKNVFQKSFERKNLTYSVKQTDTKINDFIELCKKNQGTAVVYVRNRRKTVEMANLLIKNGISADFYHAGLSMSERSRKQDNWKNNQTRIMVSTNAFGMGIDKPDVRFVIHLDLPDSLEAYFQEAGRAGRDELEAKAILLVESADRDQLIKNFEAAFPPLEMVKNVYHALGNYLKIPIGSGQGIDSLFSLEDFSKLYKFNPMVAYNALKLLDMDEYISLSEDVDHPSRIIFKTNREDLYNFQIQHPKDDPFIKLLLRTYSGLFTEYVRIDEASIAKRTNLPVEKIIEWLRLLHKYDIIDYNEQKKGAVITYITPRLDSNNIVLSKEVYSIRKKRMQHRIEQVINYAFSNNKCRSQLLLMYFGDKNPYRCGKCDVCLQRNELNISAYEFDLIVEELKNKISENTLAFEDIIENTAFPKEKTTKVFQWLLDNGKITQTKTLGYRWVKKAKEE
ncbi:MAG TPA: ATP-dependent DNA helicase RecQ [Bacteroidales bacterium]|nr:ATP-dependent DNA helicase RecQ [Bacteroidales bacterium]HOU97991.1 ATP-dependent DNA helicase RecQ [Bacteroidales bacterium]